jgi:signal peptidase
MTTTRPTSRRQSVAAWLLLARVVIARAILGIVAGLAFWAIALLPLGLSSTVIASGSMRPSIQVGDVVVTRPINAHTDILGRVVTAANPAKPGHLLSHRIVADHKDGTYQTKGDANRDPDSTPMPRSNIKGRGFLLVPWIGLPSHWLATGQPVPVVVTALGLGALAFAARDPEAEADGEQTTERSARHLAGSTRRAAAAGGLVVAILGAGAALTPAALARSAADFNAVVQNGGNNIRIDQCLTTTMTYNFETDANCWQTQTAMQPGARTNTWHNGAGSWSYGGVATFSGNGDSGLLIRPGGINLAGKTTMTAVVDRDPNVGGTAVTQAHIFYENYTPSNGWYFCTTGSNYVQLANSGTGYTLTWTLPADDGSGNGCNRSQARAVGVQFWTNSGATGTDKVYVDDFKIT